MLKKQVTFVAVFALAITAILYFQNNALAKRGGEGGRGDGPIVYVTSQGLYFDSIVAADPLPPNGPFQQLFPPGTNPDYPFLNSLSTEFGPGDPGYVGGRWWVDVDGNDMMDAGVDHFFICPLLGPGRAVP